ncbi:hypothetical protein BJ878DRAFT_513957 [Calycina marina]|uniref:Uncharacterized protein n=1 Tax=Calycina marina TaxID=1763456 RepID=A0A9P8CD73_9HELO|nr:hypothetical protein BJ878DRAFT_513957 [Calycina marina]
MSYTPLIDGGNANASTSLGTSDNNYILSPEMRIISPSSHPARLQTSTMPVTQPQPPPPSPSAPLWHPAKHPTQEPVQHSNQRANMRLGALAGESDGRIEKKSEVIPFSRIPSVESPQELHDEEELESIHFHKATSSGPLSSHTHVESCIASHRGNATAQAQPPGTKTITPTHAKLVSRVKSVGEKVKESIDRALNEVCAPSDTGEGVGVWKGGFPRLGYWGSGGAFGLY